MGITLLQGGEPLLADRAISEIVTKNKDTIKINDLEQKLSILQEKFKLLEEQNKLLEDKNKMLQEENNSLKTLKQPKIKKNNKIKI